ncbi:adhesion G protein-coupled receptor E1-like [Chiloscyllium plagiosum]|uniref:adhesion G protein-coupled receptor E1-like n=1 Tax=Chiloscyllium plagiosum TaxID=36176 RepID=UPI001CB869F0|nr:adhesion G protein-coupled receptor E1-like [Chiloscyllium plagiosum]
MKISCGLLFLVVCFMWGPCPAWSCSGSSSVRKSHNRVDINHCTSSLCDPSALCRNLTGNYDCYCGTGFTPIPGSSGIATVCKDVDECENEDVCGKNTTCHNSLGSYRCICRAGFQPVPEQTQGTCTVQPLNCPNPKKPNNSILAQCGGKHSQTLEQPNSVGDESCFIRESARRLLDKVCQNFSITDDIQAIANFTNSVFRMNSQLQNMTTSQQLNVAATILNLLENTAMAVALTLPSGETKSISEDSFGKVLLSTNANPLDVELTQ